MNYGVCLHRVSLDCIQPQLNNKLPADLRNVARVFLQDYIVQRQSLFSPHDPGIRPMIKLLEMKEVLNKKQQMMIYCWK